MVFLQNIDANIQSVLHLSSQISKASSKALAKNIATLTPQQQRLLQDVIKTTKTVLPGQNSSSLPLKERIKVYFSPLLRLLGTSLTSKEPSFDFLNDNSLIQQINQLQEKLFASGHSIEISQLSLAQRIQTLIQSYFSSTSPFAKALAKEALSLKSHKEMLSDISTAPSSTHHDHRIAKIKCAALAQAFENKVNAFGYSLLELCSLDVEKLKALKDQLSTYKDQLDKLASSYERPISNGHAPNAEHDQEYRQKLKDFMRSLSNHFYSAIPEELQKDFLGPAQLLARLEAEQKYAKNTDTLQRIFADLSSQVRYNYPDAISKLIDLAPQAKAAIRLRGYTALFAPS